MNESQNESQSNKLLDIQQVQRPTACNVAVVPRAFLRLLTGDAGVNAVGAGRAGLGRAWMILKGILGDWGLPNASLAT